jgi:MFS family permease
MAEADTSDAQKKISALDVLRDRNFGCLFAARTLSVLGNGFGRVALAFGILGSRGSSPFDLSVVLACQALPQLLFVLVGGVVADRLSRYRLMVTAELTAGCAWAAITYLVHLTSIHLIPLAVAAVVAGSATALFSPAMTGLVPEIVPASRLQQANATIRVGQNVSLLLGLSGAGILVAVLGPASALSLNTASFFFSALLVSRVRIPRRDSPKMRFGADLRQGAREFFARQWLWVVVAQFAFVLAAVNAMNGVLGPLMAVQRLGGARAWAVLATAQAIGTVGGAGLAAKIRVRRPILVAVITTLGLGLPMACLAAGAPLAVIALSMCAAGVATDIFSVLWSTTMQQQIPADVISRVSSFDSFGSLAFAPLGLLVAGPLAARFGTRQTLAGCAALVALSCAAALLSRQVRTLQAQNPSLAPSGRTADVPTGK